MNTVVTAMAKESGRMQMVPFHNALGPESSQYYVVVPLNHFKDSVKPCEIKQNLINRPFSITAIRLANEKSI